MTETQLLRERSEELRHSAAAALGTKCNGACCAECGDGWLERQRQKVIRYEAEKSERIRRRDVNLTALEAQDALKRATDLLQGVEKHAAEVEAERARLGLGGKPFRSVEDWIHAGRMSFGCGFLPGR